MNTDNLLREQYRTSNNLNARANLHERFSTNPQGWFSWYLDQLDLPPGSQILELGCGPAFLWQAVLERRSPAWQLMLTDYSPGMLYEARRRLMQAGAGFAFASVDAQAIPFPDSSFDAVLANHMLYHVPDKTRAFLEIRRVLRPGGRLFAATNGLGHMAELYDLINHLPGNLDPDRYAPGMWAKSFTLENGPEQLLQVFAKVDTRRYPDSLKVTEAQPLVDYVLSMIRNSVRPLSGDQVQAFQEQVEQKLREQGAIHIRKESGLMIASLDF